MIEQHVVDVDVLQPRCISCSNSRDEYSTASAIDASKASGRMHGRSRKRAVGRRSMKPATSGPISGQICNISFGVLPGAVDEDARLAAIPALDHRRQAVAQPQHVVEDRVAAVRVERDGAHRVVRRGREFPVELLAEALAGPFSGADARSAVLRSQPRSRRSEACA